MRLAEITKPLIELLHDASEAEDLLTVRDDAFARRAYMRAVMASVEGVVWLLKETCLKLAKEHKLRLSVAEYAMLRDETYDLKNNRDVRTQTKFLKLPDNLRFTIATCNRLLGTSADLEVGTVHWEAFLAAVAIRNRITHPKSAADLVISDDDIDLFKRVDGHFNAIVAGLVRTLEARSHKRDG